MKLTKIDKQNELVALHFNRPANQQTIKILLTYEYDI